MSCICFSCISSVRFSSSWVLKNLSVAIGSLVALRVEDEALGLLIRVVKLMCVGLEDGNLFSIMKSRTTKGVDSFC